MALISLLIVSFILHGHSLSTEPPAPPAEAIFRESKRSIDVPLFTYSYDIQHKLPLSSFHPIAAPPLPFALHSDPSDALKDNSLPCPVPSYEDHNSVYLSKNAPTLHPPICHSSYPSLFDVTATTRSSPHIIQQRQQQLVHRKDSKLKNRPLFYPPIPPTRGQSPTMNSPICIQHPLPLQPKTELWGPLSIPAPNASNPPIPRAQKSLEELHHYILAKQLTASHPRDTLALKMTSIAPAKHSLIPPYTSKIFFPSPDLSSTIPSHVAKSTQHSEGTYHTTLPPQNLCPPDDSLIRAEQGEYSSLADNNPSRAVEIIEEYNHKNSTFLGDIPLATRILEAYVSDKTSHFINQNVRLTQAFLAEIPSLSSLNTISYNNEFETAIHYTQHEGGEGYDFLLKLTPSKKIFFTPPSKNIIFVIDESNSIHKPRFNTFKAGVTRALPYLKQGDTFNILIHGTRLTFMNTSSIHWGERAIEAASRFLDSYHYKGSSVRYDTLELITQVLPYCNDERENIFIILTDGKSLNSIDTHRIALQQLMATNQDRHLSIFTASVSRDNNFLMLDLISRFNSGELIHSGTHAPFPRKLATLTKYIGNLVARKISIQTTTGDDTDAKIKFYPDKYLLSPLYLDRPYIICGSIKELKDFNLILQGTTSDRQWINIKQHISFQGAKKATHAMKRDIALERAHLCYNLFLEQADHTFLTEAQRHLNPKLLPDLLK